ncbi:MAG: hypothetical protein BJ554DRAFT_136, partial [Olpidium bornovanus]
MGAFGQSRQEPLFAADSAPTAFLERPDLHRRPGATTAARDEPGSGSAVPRASSFAPRGRPEGTADAAGITGIIGKPLAGPPAAAAPASSSPSYVYKVGSTADGATGGARRLVSGAAEAQPAVPANSPASSAERAAAAAAPSEPAPPPEEGDHGKSRKALDDRSPDPASKAAADRGALVKAPLSPLHRVSSPSPRIRGLALGIRSAGQFSNFAPPGDVRSLPRSPAAEDAGRSPLRSPARDDPDRSQLARAGREPAPGYLRGSALVSHTKEEQPPPPPPPPTHGFATPAPLTSQPNLWTPGGRPSPQPDAGRRAQEQTRGSTPYSALASSAVETLGPSAGFAGNARGSVAADGGDLGGKAVDVFGSLNYPLVTESFAATNALVAGLAQHRGSNLPPTSAPTGAQITSAAEALTNGKIVPGQKPERGQSTNAELARTLVHPAPDATEPSTAPAAGGVNAARPQAAPPVPKEIRRASVTVLDRADVHPAGHASSPAACGPARNADSEVESAASSRKQFDPSKGFSITSLLPDRSITSSIGSVLRSEHRSSVVGSLLSTVSDAPTRSSGSINRDSQPGSAVAEDGSATDRTSRFSIFSANPSSRASPPASDNDAEPRRAPKKRISISLPTPPGGGRPSLRGLNKSEHVLNERKNEEDVGQGRKAKSMPSLKADEPRFVNRLAAAEPSGRAAAAGAKHSPEVRAAEERAAPAAEKDLPAAVHSSFDNLARASVPTRRYPFAIKWDPTVLRVKCEHMGEIRLAFLPMMELLNEPRAIQSIRDRFAQLFRGCAHKYDPAHFLLAYLDQDGDWCCLGDSSEDVVAFVESSRFDPVRAASRVARLKTFNKLHMHNHLHESAHLREWNGAHRPAQNPGVQQRSLPPHVWRPASVLSWVNNFGSTHSLLSDGFEFSDSLSKLQSSMFAGWLVAGLALFGLRNSQFWLSAGLQVPDFDRSDPWYISSITAFGMSASFCLYASEYYDRLFSRCAYAGISEATMIKPGGCMRHSPTSILPVRSVMRVLHRDGCPQFWIRTVIQLKLLDTFNGKCRCKHRGHLPLLQSNWLSPHARAFTHPMLVMVVDRLASANGKLRRAM